MNQLLNDLNDEQKLVVRQTEGPMLVLAGAGSGKTRCITYKVAYLVAEKLIDPERILLLTFTNKAAGEMKARVEKLTGKNLTLAGTFHSLCAKILRREGRLINLPINYLIYDEDDQVEVVKQAMNNLALSTRDFKPRSVLATISEAKNELINEREYPQYARGEWQKMTARVYLEYQKLLREAGAVDFDDLLTKTVELFNKQPQRLAYYQNLWQYLLVDEYQDTNQAQFQLTKMLAGKWKNLCCVGDFSQSVYRWRGADFRNLARLKEEFTNLKTFYLEQNYRSTQTILDAAEGIITQNTTHPVLKLWTKKGKGDRITLFEAEDEKAEAGFIVETIKNNQLHNSQFSFSEFAVLYRTNAQSRAIEEALIRAGVPYRLVGGTRFYQRKEIKDCLAMLRVIANSKDKVSWQRIEKLGKGRLNKFQEWTENNEQKIESNEGKRTKQLLTLEILDQILAATGYLELYNPKDEEDLVRLENIKELRSVATEFSNLDSFLENVALVEADEKVNVAARPHPATAGSDGGQVTLMTLHAAKGLEFRTVFLIGMEEGLFPHSRSLMDKEQLEEERRLAYVGITRAKEKVYLTFTRRRLYFGVRSHNYVSRFIGEIPEHLLDMPATSWLETDDF